MQASTKDQAELAEMAKRTGQEALDLVRQTAQAIKLAEEREQLLARQSQERAQRAVDELKAAGARIASLEEQVLCAEARFMESEQALQRVHDELKKTLSDRPPQLRSVERSQAA